MRFSPIPLALVSVLGIILASEFGIAVSCVALAAMVTAFLIYSLIKREIDLGIILIIVVFTVASASYFVSVSNYKHKSLDYLNRYVTLKGVVISAAEQTSNDNYRYVFKINSIANKYGVTDTTDNILLTTPEKLSCYDELTVKGIIKDMPHRMNENGFDAAKYYKSNNIFARMHTEDIVRNGRVFVFSPYAAAEYVSERIDDIIHRYYKGDGAAILSAVLTGNKHNFSDDYDDLLSVTAFKRVLHPAHLHIWIILSVIGLFSRFTRKQHRDITAAAILLVYAAIQCTNIGFSRCLVCAALTVIYKLRHGISFFPDTIAVVVILCAVTMPTVIYNCTFILSAAGGILSWAFTPYLAKKLKFIPEFLRRTCSNIIVFAVLLTPLSSYYFNGLCIYSVFTSFITAPIVLTILITSPVVFICLSLFGAAPFFGAYLNASVKILYELPFLIRSLPFSYISTGRASLICILLFLCIILSLYYLTKSRKEMLLIPSAAALGFCLSLALSTAVRVGSVELTFVNVGHGDASVIRTPFKETLIIDGGGGSYESDYDPGKALFVPYLDSLGINHIEIAVVSHYHQDHVQGVIDTISRIKTDYVFAPKISDSDDESMREWAATLRDTAQMCGTKLCYVSDDTRLEFDDGLTVDIYAPPEHIRKITENNTSLLVKVQYGDFSALYTGDMTSLAERNFIHQADVDADILKVSHHGSRDSSAKEFLDAVTPDYAVISCAENNVYSHPHTEVLERLADVPVLRTDILGDIRVRARKTGFFVIK